MAARPSKRSPNALPSKIASSAKLLAAASRSRRFAASNALPISSTRSGVVDSSDITAASIPRSVRCGLSSSARIVDRDGVGVRVSERERPAEGTIDRLSQDRHTVLDESVMKDLGVLGSKP